MQAQRSWGEKVALHRTFQKRQKRQEKRTSIEEGAAGLFVDYFQEYMDLYRARGLIASAPIDESILRRKVLGRRTGGGGATPTPAAAGASSAALAQTEQVNELLREATRSRVAAIHDARPDDQDEGGD